MKSKRLSDILDGVEIESIIGDRDIAINQLRLDSRKVERGDVYVAIPGYRADGHDYIESALKNGAKVIVCSKLNFDFPPEVVIVRVSDSRKAMVWMAKNYYGDPSRRLKLIGVTGTNGKTTVVTLFWQMLTEMGYKVALLSTVENRIGSQIYESTHTTPDAIEVQRFFSEAVNEGCEYGVMEVSSHAIDQQRIGGLRFEGAIFTNMSHDHLDYHKTFKEYIYAKKKFFDELDKDAFALVNIDDKHGEVMVQNTKARIVTYGLKRPADYKAKVVDDDISGLHLLIDRRDVYFLLVGLFNAYNILAVYGGALEMSLGKEEVLSALSKATGAEGRFERIEGGGIVGIVDYAHTPDALDNVLSTIDKLKSPGASLIVVAGCGGDRDREKRPKMAKVSARWGDVLVMTSDNPRTEDPDQILDDMEAGLDGSEGAEIWRIANRKEAIQRAVAMAKKGDIILVAGKGHEKYQDIKGVKVPFDDKKVLREAISQNA